MANKDNFLASNGETIPVEGERMTTMRESVDIELKKVVKQIKTKDDKRIWLTDRTSIPIEMSWGEIPKFEGNGEFSDYDRNMVECPYCSGGYPEYIGYKHISEAGNKKSNYGCPAYHDLLTQRFIKDSLKAPEVIA